MRHQGARLSVVAAGAILALAVIAVPASAMSFGGWGQPHSLEAGGSGDLNTAALEGCPSFSRDGLKLYFASNRAGQGYGGIDIYVATRSSTTDGWGAPTNLGPAVNTAADELCPTPMRDGHGLLFVSSMAGGCGGWDLYATRRHVTRGWGEPRNLGCGVNSAQNEASPFIVGAELYFSSNRADASNLYVAALGAEGAIGAPAQVAGLNTASADARPNLRRDGLEIFFDSNRPNGCGGFDLWTATRTSTDAPWSTPVNLGCGVNSPLNDLRASVSWEGTHLAFGSDRAGTEGNQDLFGTSRERGAAGCA